MADKAIQELNPVTRINMSDNFVLEQNNRAMRLTGEVLRDWLLVEMRSHGGIVSIEKTGHDLLVDTYTITYVDETTSTFEVTNGRSIVSVDPPATPSSTLVDTYTISYNDETESTFDITNGRGITNIQKTSTSGRQDTYTITYNNNTTSTFIVTNGEQGEKGDKGDTGNDLTVSSVEIKYGRSTNPNVQPTEWYDVMPSTAHGEYLWTRVTLNFSDLSSATYYTRARDGIDGGGGTVSSVSGILPDPNGNVDVANVVGTALVIGE